MESATVALGHSHEDHHHGPPEAHQSSRMDRQTLGIYLFIVSEIMLFGAFFAAYFFLRVVVDPPTWPPHPYELPVAIAETFGSMDDFKKQFAAAAMSRFGSGWAWLSAKADGKLVVHSTANQDSPLSEGLVPVIGLDVWEHAYYLHYQNRRADFVAAFWNVLNWTQAEVNYAAVRRG